MCFCSYRGRKIYEPPRYLTANDAIRQILEITQSDDETLEGKDCKMIISE